MIRVLVVDDEAVIADGIHEIVSAIEYDLEVYTAYSGKKALEFIEQYRVDILVTDICMGEIDGLALQQRISVVWPFCQVIFLTGHDDFSYIQKAVRGNSLDYILKSESDEQVRSAVEKAIENVESERKKKFLLGKVESEMKEFIPLLNKELMTRLLHGVRIPREELGVRFQKQAIPLDAKKRVILVLGRIEGVHSPSVVPADFEVILQLQQMVNKHLEQRMDCLGVSITGEMLLWFIQPKDNSTSSFYSQERNDLCEKSAVYLFETLDIVQQQIQDSHQMSMSFIITKKAVKWEDIPLEYDKLNFILNTNYCFARQIVLMENNCKDKNAPPHDNSLFADIENKLDLLEIYLNNAYKKEYDAIINEVVGALVTGDEKDVQRKVRFFFILSSAFLKLIYKNDLFNDINRDINLERLININKNGSFRKVGEYIVSLGQSLYKCKNDRSILQGKCIIENVKEHIKNNLKKDLSLTLLADMFHFNSSYFSRQYKAETGQSLTKYILEQRIEAAKDLLSRHEKVQEAAKEVGFHSTSYFIHVFKTKTGLTPKQFYLNLE